MIHNQGPGAFRCIYAYRIVGKFCRENVTLFKCLDQPKVINCNYYFGWSYVSLDCKSFANFCQTFLLYGM